jgi:hypothetical protein
VPGAAQKLAGDESGPVDSEEQSGLGSGAEPFEVNPFGQRGDFAAAHQRHVARLNQHRFADREQHQHDAGPDGISEEQQQCPALADQQMTEGEGEEQGAS